MRRPGWPSAPRGACSAPIEPELTSLFGLPASVSLTICEIPIVLELGAPATGVNWMNPSIPARWPGPGVGAFTVTMLTLNVPMPGITCAGCTRLNCTPPPPPPPLY